nr:hypothetical protein [Tanacetum cinerariifolium]
MRQPGKKENVHSGNKEPGKKESVHSGNKEVSSVPEISTVEEYPHCADNTKIDLYFELPLLLPYFQPIPMPTNVGAGMTENVPIKINKYLFSSEFVIIDMVETDNETMVLGRPFLATIHAEIDVFAREISLGIGNDRVNFNTDKIDYEFTSSTEEVYMLQSLPTSRLSDELTTHEFNRLLGIDSDIFCYESYKGMNDNKP